MCATFQLYSDDELEDIKNICREIEKRHGAEAVAKYTNTDFYPKSIVPVIDTNNEVALLPWGFPMSGKSEVIFNARAESLVDKPMYRGILNNRCLIPATAFYEWDHSKKKRKIQLANAPFFYLAGLYKPYQNKDGGKDIFFTVITTEPSEQMKEIHNRMPVIITKAEASFWLQNNWNAASAMMRTYHKEFIIS